MKKMLGAFVLAAPQEGDAPRAWAWLDEDGTSVTRSCNNSLEEAVHDFAAHIEATYPHAVSAHMDHHAKRYIDTLDIDAITSLSYGGHNRQYPLARALAQWKMWEDVLAQRPLATPKDHTSLVLATDGSHNDKSGTGAWCWVGPNEMVGAGIEHGHPVSFLELSAVNDALDATPVDVPVTILTDSLLCVEVAHGRALRIAKRPKEQELRAALYEKTKSRDVRIQWVRAHNGHPLNCRVDHLVRNLLRAYDAVHPVEALVA